MIVLDSIEKTCHACPSQWQGETSDGLVFYARYRWGWLSVNVGKETIFEKSLGDGLDGFLEGKELAFQLKGLVDFSHIDRMYWD